MKKKNNCVSSCSFRSMQVCAIGKPNTYIRFKNRLFNSYFCPKQTYQKLLFIMLFGLLNGLVASCCTTRTAMHMQSNQEASGSGPLQPSNHPPETEETINSGPRFGVVCLHGFMNKATEVDPIAASLRDAFGSDVLLIQPTCRKGVKSLFVSLEGQTQAILETIKEDLKQANQPVSSFPLFIVGYSHGGLVGCTLAKDHGSNLNIKGVVTINAPLGGTPALQCSTTDVDDFISEAEEGWEVLTQILPDQYVERFGKSYQLKTLCNGTEQIGNMGQEHSIKQGMLNKCTLLSGLAPFCPGAQSLLSDSVSVRNVRSFLREDQNNNIPCLLIGSYVEFGSLFGIDSASAHAGPIDRLGKAYATFVTGEEGGKHDTLIPLKSQLCRGPSFESLTTADPNDKSWMIHTVPGRPHVQAQVYEGATHARKLMVLDDELLVTGSGIEKLPAVPSVLKRVVDFVQEHSDPASKSMKEMQQMDTPCTAGTNA